MNYSFIYGIIINNHEKKQKREKGRQTQTSRRSKNGINQKIIAFYPYLYKCMCTAMCDRKMIDFQNK